MIECPRVVMSPGTDLAITLARVEVGGARPPTHAKPASASPSCRSERPDVAPPKYAKYSVFEPGALSITVRWTIVSPGFPILTGRTSRPVFVSEAAGASLVP